MSQTLLKKAADYVAKAAGLDAVRDRDEVLELTNDVRELLYQESSLVWNATFCAPLRCFCSECGDACNVPWSGITLPAWVENALGVWHDSRPIAVTDRWGIYPYDASWQVQPHLQAVDMGSGYVFEADPPCGQPFCLGFLARKRSDTGKTVTVRFKDDTGRERTEEVELGTTWTCLRHVVSSVPPGGISLPDDLTGQVVARTGDGLTLAVYQPWETVPGFRRLRIQQRCCGIGQMLSVHAERKFVRLYEDSDVVETDKKLIWEDGYKHLMLHRKTSADQADVVNAARFAAAFKARIEIEARKSWGRTKRTALRFESTGPRGSGLLAGR